jgi:hypothetical protein
MRLHYWGTMSTTTTLIFPAFVIASLAAAADLDPVAGRSRPARIYTHALEPLADPEPLLADLPAFTAPIADDRRLQGPPLVDDEAADLSVRAWRYSYNIGCIVEFRNRLDAHRTAVIVVHPWGLEDGQGWQMPQPAGFAFGSQAMIRSAADQMRTAIRPFLDSLRGRVSLVMYSLPGVEDPIRRKLYRSIRGRPTTADVAAGRQELAQALLSHSYEGLGEVPRTFELSRDTPVVDYFRSVTGGDAGPHFNGAGFWDLPIPVHAEIGAQPDDVVIYDADGYAPLKAFLASQGIRHVLLLGFATDMCVRDTTAGYRNLRENFNVFLVGDLTQATCQGNASPACSTTAAVSRASLDVLITQASWVKPDPDSRGEAAP